MRVSLNWLKDYVSIKGGLEKAQHALTMIGLEVGAILDVENDKVMDIEITPNRPDCLSFLGIARELAAATQQSVKIPSTINQYYMKKASGQEGSRVTILDKRACPRYVGRVIKKIEVGPSPQWLVSRLNALGVRSVNNVVDITNYVLFETGQPLHAFDLDKLEGKKIIVRKAKKGETIVTIDGVRRELDPGMLVIADAKSPVAIAGIMGGKDTEITEETQDILLESAYFDPVTVRKAQRKLGLASESSYRFERGVDFAMILAASARAEELIRDMAEGRRKGIVTDVGGQIVKNREIILSLSEVTRVLGIELSAPLAINLLQQLDLKTSKKGKDSIVVQIPSYRQDLESDIDIIEELARLYGYDKIPVKMPGVTIQKTYTEEKKAIRAVVKKAKTILYSLGMDEIVTYTLTSRFSIETLGISFDNVVRLQNPLSSNQEFMRPSLSSEMLEVLSWNMNRKNPLLGLFELSKVYFNDKKNSGVQEKLHLSLGMAGVLDGNWKDRSREIDFFDLKGLVAQFLDFLGIKDYSIEKEESVIFKDALSATLKVGGQVMGILGEVKPDLAKKFDIKQKVYLAEIYFEDLLKHIDLKTRFMPLPRYPSVKRDISILVDDSVTASGILDVIKKEGGSLIKAVKLFDLYKGHQIEQDKKSLGFTMEYRSDEKTLKEEDIAQIHKRIQDAMVKKIGAQIR